MKYDEIYEHGVIFSKEEYEIAQTIKVLLHTKLSIPDGVSRFAKWLYKEVPTHRKRNDLATHDPHEGYIYIIMDPRLAEDANVIFIGSSRRPWEAVERHIVNSTVKKMRAYAFNMVDDISSDELIDIYIRGKEEVDLYEGDIKESDLTPMEEHVVLIPWKVIDFQPGVIEKEINHKDSGFISINFISSKRIRWTKYYRNLGHPVLNGSSGRPRNN